MAKCQFFIPCTDLSLNIATLGSLVSTMPNEVCFLDGVYGNQLPCELAYIPKNEQSCQLAKRVQNLIRYISERCDILLNRDINKKVLELQKAAKSVYGKCPEIGQPISRVVRKKISEIEV